MMGYTVGDSARDRCLARTYVDVRCALVAGHINTHVTPGGSHFYVDGGRLLDPAMQPGVRCRSEKPRTSTADPVTRCVKPLGHTGEHRASSVTDGGATWTTPQAGQRLTDTDVYDLVHHALSQSDSAQSDSAQSDSAQSDSAQSDSAQFDSAQSDSAQFDPGLTQRLAAAEAHLHQMRKQMDRLTHDVNDTASRAYMDMLSIELATTRANLANRLDAHTRETAGGILGLRRDLNRLIGMVGADAWNGRKQLETTERVDDVYVKATKAHERIDRVERDLAGTDKAVDTHNRRIERLERQPAQWDADSTEPPRDRTYLDQGDYVWRFKDGAGWQFRYSRGSTWSSGNDAESVGGWTWTELADGTAERNDVSPQFPWEVVTDGAE